MYNWTFRKLNAFIYEYFELRGLEWPGSKDAVLFLTTELGELVDALMRQESGWVRNNQKECNVYEEAADCLYMILVIGQVLEIDLAFVLAEKLCRKLEENGKPVPSWIKLLQDENSDGN